MKQAIKLYHSPALHKKVQYENEDAIRYVADNVGINNDRIVITTSWSIIDLTTLRGCIKRLV